MSLSGAAGLTLTILSILSILFGALVYILSRIGNVEKKVEIECALRQQIEERMKSIESKIDTILTHFSAGK